jgi:alkylation response protein AidB-like acyl-CoA dehydrogenase
MTATDALLSRARAIADDVLFPRAMETDRSDLVPESNLAALAEAGLLGLAGPREYGGSSVDIQTMGLIVEALAGACLSTAFVWIQHHRPVRALAESSNLALRERYLRDMCAGSVRVGVALGGMREPAQVRAARVEDGYVLDGVVPFVTGWGRIGMLYTTARTAEDVLVSVLIDAEERETLGVRPLSMVACNATGTVEASFARHVVPDEAVVSAEAYMPAPPHDGGGRINGSLSLGVAGRCCRLIGESVLDEELRALREQLDAATDDTMAVARAAATAFVVRCATALAVHTGSSSLLSHAHPQRLMREAMFLLNFGTRPAIRHALLRRIYDS